MMPSKHPVIMHSQIALSTRRGTQYSRVHRMGSSSKPGSLSPRLRSGVVEACPVSTSTGALLETGGGDSGASISDQTGSGVTSDSSRPPLSAPQSSSMATPKPYTWDQTAQEVTIAIPIEAVIKGKDIVYTLTPKSLKVPAHPPAPRGNTRCQTLTPRHVSATQHATSKP
jgi:hypothetical protein